jgi:hypothetical protein
MPASQRMIRATIQLPTKPWSGMAPGSHSPVKRIATPGLIHYRCACSGGDIGRVVLAAVVDDDDLMQPCPWQLSEDDGKTVFFIESGDDDTRFHAGPLDIF